MQESSSCLSTRLTYFLQHSSRQRASSITRHLTGFGELKKKLTESSTHTDDTEESNRKRKLLLGGHKLLGKLRDQ